MRKASRSRQSARARTHEGRSETPEARGRIAPRARAADCRCVSHQRPGTPRPAPPCSRHSPCQSAGRPTAPGGRGRARAQARLPCAPRRHAPVTVPANRPDAPRRPAGAGGRGRRRGCRAPRRVWGGFASARWRSARPPARAAAAAAAARAPHGTPARRRGRTRSARTRNGAPTARSLGVTSILGDGLQGTLVDEVPTILREEA